MRNYLFFLVIIILTANVYSATLELDHIEYSWNTACQYYNVLSDVNVEAKAPQTYSLSIVYGDILSEKWEISTTKTIQETQPVYKTTCINVSNNLSGTISQCTTLPDLTKTATTINKTIQVYTTDFSKESLTKAIPKQVRYCVELQRQYIKGQGWVILADMIPELDGTIYEKYAWFNSTLSHRYDIINETNNFPSWINGTQGFNGTNIITNSLQYNNLTFYFQNTSFYNVVINDTSDAPFETENGERNWSIKQIYNNATGQNCTNNNSINLMLHFGFQPEGSNRTTFNSACATNDTAINANTNLSTIYGLKGKGLLWDGANMLKVYNGKTRYFNALTRIFFVRPKNATQWSDGTDAYFNVASPLLQGYMFATTSIALECGGNYTNPDSVDTTLTNKWYMISIVCDGAYCYEYVNETLIDTLACGYTISADERIGDRAAGGQNLGGTYMDEVMYISRNMSVAQLSAILNNTLNASSTYMFGTQEEKPAIDLIFNAQSPTDITATSMFFSRAVISYNITTSQGTIDNTSVKIFYKTNSTTSDCLRIINGTSYCSWRNTTYDNATGSTYNFSLGDAKVYPYTENLEFQTYFRNIEHTPDTLTTANSYEGVQLINISTNKTYSYFEITVNATNQLQIPVIFCNSSFDFTNPSGNTNCAAFYTINNSNTFNHTHNISVSNASSHHVIPFAVNTSTLTVGGVKVTATGYFLIRGQTGQAISLWKVNNVTRDNATIKTTNSGSAWTSPSYTIDAHLHQFSQSDTLYYYACANTSTINLTCSDIRSDLLNQTTIPPTAPFVYSPPENNVTLTDRNVDINYTEAISPIGNNITGYNISLYDNTYTFIAFIHQNALNLSYLWNNTGYEGQYRIGVDAWDSAGQSSTGFSEIFNISRSTATTTTTTTTTTSAVTTTTYPDAASGINKTLYIYSIMLPIFAFVSTIAVFYFSSSRIKIKEHIVTDGEHYMSDGGREKVSYLLSPALPLISSLLWFMSSFTTINIKFIFDFTTGARPYYVDQGNVEIGYLFTALGVIMGLVFILTVIQVAYDSSKAGLRKR